MATQVLVPPLGQTVDTVTLVGWLKEEGEAVKQGEMLFTIETDKAILDVEAPASGLLQGVTARPGDEVQVLSPIAFIAPATEVMTGAPPPPAVEPAAAQESPVPASVTLAGTTTEAASGPPAPGQGAGERLFISPRARRLAEANGIPLAALRASGPEGAIVERDVCAYLAAQVPPAGAPAVRQAIPDAENATAVAESVVARSERRLRATKQPPTDQREIASPQTTAARNDIPPSEPQAASAGQPLGSSTTTVPVTLNIEAEATALVALRQRLARDGLEVSDDALFLYILGRALRDHPRLNASLQRDTPTIWQPIHVALAVDTEQGLLLPVVRHVEGKRLGQLAGEIESLAGRARAGQCTSEELSGSTFALANLGTFGLDSLTPLVDQPECAVLGVGRIKKQGEGHHVWLSLTFDRRLVDRIPAARFMQRLVQLVEQPYLLLT